MPRTHCLWLNTYEDLLVLLFYDKIKIKFNIFGAVTQTKETKNVNLGRGKLQQEIVLLHRPKNSDKNRS